MGMFDRFRMMRARERYMPTPSRVRRSTSLAVALAVILLSVTLMIVLERQGEQREARIVAWVEEHAVEPVGLITRAARNRPLLLLGDVAGATAPKRLAAQLIDSLGRAGGLDAVALEVPADQQTWIDLYLETDPEDTSVLLAHPRTIREGEGAGRALLEVYRAVWRVNHEIGANRRVRVFALDPPDWPPPAGLSPARAVAAFARRDAHMFDVLVTRMLERSPRARMLVFVDGLRVRRGGARLATGGVAPIDFDWLGQRLAQHGAAMYTVLVDAPRGPGAAAPLAGHRASPLYDLLSTRLTLPRQGLAIAVAPASEIPGDWLGQAARPGIVLSPVPPDAEPAQLIDAWVFLPN